MLTHARIATGVRAGLILVCVGVLAGCGPRRPDSSEALPATTAQSAASAIPPGAAAYAIDAERSVVTLRVYRAGRLAKLGHNHVITSANETGYAWTSGAPATSGFEVRVAVAELVVDEPAARAAAGEDFPGTLPDSAREGTRRNMLRPEVLDGDRYPEIVVRADSLGGTWEQPTVTASVTLKGVTRRIEVPVAIREAGGTLEARGSFRILQSDFGITPFSVGGGAIQVADGVDLGFEIVATPR
jgi:polyisoprenoid-binding protein YceI